MAYLLPGAGAVGLARPVHGGLELPQVDQRGGQPAEVGHVVIQQLGRVVHLVVVATVAHLRTRTRGEKDGRKGEEGEHGSGLGTCVSQGGDDSIKCDTMYSTKTTK